MNDLRAGQVFSVGPFTTTALPTLDWETFSEAGYLWVPEVLAPDSDLFAVASSPNTVRGKWTSLPGMSAQNKGIGAVGARNYIEHPSFEILSLAYDLLDGKGPRRWVPPFGMNRASGQRPDSNAPGYPWDLLVHVMEGGQLEAWNSAFEWQVWEFFCVPCWGWPSLRLDQMRCAMAKSRAAAFPGALDEAATVLKTTPKDKRGKDLIRKLTVPRNPTKANPELRWTPFTASDDFRAFYEYNDTDVTAEIDASLRLPDLSPRELRVWLFDQLVNMRGMQVDRVSIENCISIVEQVYARYRAELVQITAGAVEDSTEVAKTLDWIREKHGIFLPNLDEETVGDALKRAYPPAVLRVLHIRQMLAYGSVKKLFAFRAMSTAAGRLTDQYVYYGAHTSLWNGRGVQPANLYKGAFSKPHQAEAALAVIAARSLELLEFEYGPHGSWVASNPKDHKPLDALEVIASCLRSLIIAKPGTRLISADFTAIQAVATSALAGEEWRLEVFRTHGKIYEAMASRLTNNPLQFYLDYRKQQGKHHEHRQNPGKLAVLSGDFGAWINGWKRFGADKLLGSDDAIKAAILKTRAAQPMISELWGGQTRNRFNKDEAGRYAPERPEYFGLEGAAIKAVLEPGNAFGYRGIVFQMFEDTLYCMPPSGGIIRYHHPRLEKSNKDWAPPWELRLTYQGWNSNPQKGPIGWVTMDLYGGVLTQNVVSHECREIQALALLALEDNGYPIVMHTHDEQVAEVPVGFGSPREYIQIVERSFPAWAVDLQGRPWPVKIPDAWEAQRYGKWED
jgi:DNA polymerase bacteriophage-type